MKSLSKRASFIIAVIIILSIGVTSIAFAENSENLSVTAKFNSSSVLVNGDKVDFESYNINDNNYFKLRDLARVVSGTEKQFDVKWDNDKKAIDLITTEPYTEVGGELVAGDGAEKTAILNTSTIYKDGEEVELVAYTINDNNYFKLRDIAQSFDIGVTWDGETKTVGIDTSIGYETTEAEEIEETTEAEENIETTEAEWTIAGATFINSFEIIVDFGKQLPDSKAGEVYASLVYIDWDGATPWEIGRNIEIHTGSIGQVIDLSNGSPEFELPGLGTYELFFGDYGTVVLEATEELFE